MVTKKLTITVAHVIWKEAAHDLWEGVRWTDARGYNEIETPRHSALMGAHITSHAIEILARIPAVAIIWPYEMTTGVAIATGEKVDTAHCWLNAEIAR